MASLKKAVNCIGLSGNVSIVRDFFGFQIGTPKTLSLRTQLRLLQGKHIHLNLIQAVNFDITRQKQIDSGLQGMREIYATANMGVGRLQRFTIPPGYEVVDGDDEAYDLWNDFSVPNYGIDVFLVNLITGSSWGKSRVPGSCDKDSKNDSGCVIGVGEINDGSTVGRVIAHEVGHYLGLEHEDDLPDNLMFPSTPNGGRLYGGQGGVMVLHCLVHGGCKL